MSKTVRPIISAADSIQVRDEAERKLPEDVPGAGVVVCVVCFELPEGSRVSAAKSQGAKSVT